MGLDPPRFSPGAKRRYIPRLFVRLPRCNDGYVGNSAPVIAPGSRTESISLGPRNPGMFFPYQAAPCPEINKLNELRCLVHGIGMVKVRSRGFRNKQHFATAIYFHLDGLDLYP